MATASEKRTATAAAYKSQLKKNVYTNDTADPKGRTQYKFCGRS